MKRIDNYKLILTNLKSSYILKNPLSLFEIKKEKLIYSEKTLYHNINNIIVKHDHTYQILLNTLKLVNPLSILDKGYSLVMKNEEVIKDSTNLKEHDKINITFAKGKIKAEVQEVINNK